MLIFYKSSVYKEQLSVKLFHLKKCDSKIWSAISLSGINLKFDGYKGSSIKYVPKISRKTNFSNPPDTHTYVCVLGG